MDFTPIAPRPVRENIVPMINVVFLLLIFFLMTARIAPPDPVAVTPPPSDSTQPADAPSILLVDADGRLFFGPHTDDAALAALPRDTGLVVRADAGLEAKRLVGILARLVPLGLPEISLATSPRP